MRALGVAALWVALVVAAGCAHEPGPVNASGQLPSEVTGSTWQWESATTVIGETKPDAPEHYTIRFDPAGRAEIRADCNSGSAPLGVGSNRQLQVGPPIALTRAACPPGSLSDEFVTELGRIRSWSIVDGKLYLSFPGDGGGLRFRAAP
jgi:heat shock protein HslJ